jgi:hypothetical protein
LHCRKSCRGKQHETKVGHDGGGPWESLGNKGILSAERFGIAINDQALGRIVAVTKRKSTLYFSGATRCARPCSLRIQALFSNPGFTLSSSATQVRPD